MARTVPAKTRALASLAWLGALGVAGAVLPASAGCSRNTCRDDIYDIEAKLDLCRVDYDLWVQRHGLGEYSTSEGLTIADEACGADTAARRQCEAKCVRAAACSSFVDSPSYEPTNTAGAQALDACVSACLPSTTTP